MGSAEFRVEANQPLASRFLPREGARQYFVHDRSLAVAIAAKSFTASGSEIRVIHVPTGEVVFRKPAAAGPSLDELDS
jgi:hypothetical protein